MPSLNQLVGGICFADKFTQLMLLAMEDITGRLQDRQEQTDGIDREGE